MINADNVYAVFPKAQIVRGKHDGLVVRLDASQEELLVEGCRYVRHPIAKNRLFPAPGAAYRESPRNKPVGA